MYLSFTHISFKLTDKKYIECYNDLYPGIPNLSNYYNYYNSNLCFDILKLRMEKKSKVFAI